MVGAACRMLIWDLEIRVHCAPPRLALSKVRISNGESQTFLRSFCQPVKQIADLLGTRSERYPIGYIEYTRLKVEKAVGPDKIRIQTLHSK